MLASALNENFSEIDTRLVDLETLVYEEGNWIPSLYGSVTPGSHMYSVRVGRYVRIGKLAQVQFRIELSSKDPAMSGFVRIGGLPFMNDQISGESAYFSNVSLGPNRTGLFFVLPSGLNYIQLNAVGSGLPASILDSNHVMDDSGLFGVVIYKIIT